MTGSGRKARVLVWLEQGLLKTRRNKVRLGASQMLCHGTWPALPRTNTTLWGPSPFALAG